MHLIYPDSPVIRSLTERPETWDELFDPFIEHFGETFKVISSYYLFFEYIGFTKKSLMIPTEIKTPTLLHQKELEKCILSKPKKMSDEQIALLDDSLQKVFTDIWSHIRKKVLELELFFNRKVDERQNRVSHFTPAKQLVEALFGEIISLMISDFNKFAIKATLYLGWDAFCSIQPIGLPSKAIRERQLGYWLQNWDQGTGLPFGKIIDDQAGYYYIDFRSKFKEGEDMVDAELHTCMIMGSRSDGRLQSINALLYPPADTNACMKRNELALGSVLNIEKTLNRTLEKNPGKLFLIDEKAHFFTEIHKPQFS